MKYKEWTKTDIIFYFVISCYCNTFYDPLSIWDDDVILDCDCDVDNFEADLLSLREDYSILDSLTFLAEVLFVLTNHILTKDLIDFFYLSFNFIKY